MFGGITTPTDTEAPENPLVGGGVVVGSGSGGDGGGGNHGVATLGHVEFQNSPPTTLNATMAATDACYTSK